MNYFSKIHKYFIDEKRHTETRLADRTGVTDVLTVATAERYQTAAAVETHQTESRRPDPRGRPDLSDYRSINGRYKDAF